MAIGELIIRRYRWTIKQKLQVHRLEMSDFNKPQSITYEDMNS